MTRHGRTREEAQAKPQPHNKSAGGRTGAAHQKRARTHTSSIVRAHAPGRTPPSTLTHKPRTIMHAITHEQTYTQHATPEPGGVYWTSENKGGGRGSPPGFCVGGGEFWPFGGDSPPQWGGVNTPNLLGCYS